MFWINLVFYEAVWFAAVIGASHGLWWPALLAALLFAAWRLVVSRERSTELRLLVIALVVGGLFDTAMIRSGLLKYATPWPAGMAPLWILALWAAFAFSIVPLFGYLQQRPLLASVFGAFGGPLAYLGASRGWHVVTFAAPIWHALMALALTWAVAMPLLTMLARRWSPVNSSSRAAQ